VHTTENLFLLFPISLSLILLCPTCSGPGSDEVSEPTNQQPLVNQEVVDPRSEAFLQQMVEDEHFSGVALVMSEGRIIHAKGYGRATSEKDNAVTTALHVASITKQFTAAAILQLVEKGAVDLETSVNEYLPEQYRSPKWDGVKIHHLLSHTSGVPDYAVVRDYYNVVQGFCLGDTVDGMVKEAMAKDLEFSPGSRFDYSNIGFTLLGLVIENQSGTAYDEYMAANIFQPMGMESSRIHVIGHVPTANEAEGHRWNEELGAHAPDEVVTLPVTAPDGGLVTTLTDFVRWTSIYMGGEQTTLSRDSLYAMLTPVLETNEADARGAPQSIGYGLFLSDRLISHEGYIVGFRSHFLVDRNTRVLIAVFSNNTTNDPKRISSGLLEILETPSR
jgi:CubicO group peptidase (beta-lactamase class C family)